MKRALCKMRMSFVYLSISVLAIISLSRFLGAEEHPVEESTTKDTFQTLLVEELLRLSTQLPMHYSPANETIMAILDGGDAAIPICRSLVSGSNRYAALFGLKMLTRLSSTVPQFFLKKIIIQHPDEIVRREALKLLDSEEVRPELAEAVIQRLNSVREPEKVVQCLQGLELLGDRSTQGEIESHLNSSDPNVRISAIRALSSLDSRSAVARLVAITGSPDESVREAAFHGLRLATDPANIDLLVDLFPGPLTRRLSCGNSYNSNSAFSPIIAAMMGMGEQALSTIHRLTRSGSTESRFHAVFMLASLIHESNIAVLVKAMQDAEPDVRQIAAVVSSRYISSDFETADLESALQTLMDDSSASVRHQTATVLAKIGEVSAIPLLIESLDENSRLLPLLNLIPEFALHEVTSYRLDYSVRGVAASTWWKKWWVEHGPSFDVLAAHLEALDPAVKGNRKVRRRASPQIISWLAGPSDSHLIAEKLCAADRSNVSRMLKRLEEKHGNMVTEFVELAGRPAVDRSTRLRAFRYLSILDPSLATRMLGNMVRTGHQDAVYIIRGVYHHLKSEQLVQEIIELLPHSHQVENNLYSALYDIATPQLCTTLLECVRKEKHHRSSGISLLGDLKCQQAKQFLIEEASSPQYRVRQAATHTLARLGDIKMVPILIKSLAYDATKLNKRNLMISISQLSGVHTILGASVQLGSDVLERRLAGAFIMRMALEIDFPLCISSRQEKYCLQAADVHEPLARRALHDAKDDPHPEVATEVALVLTLLAKGHRKE
ncbi:HEAT repeat domain-containing protein [candidate division CSSED10-310 bacterium]|uniref:HEAT repeat domain-containing protein n=1 Tax=candidate division CSSED10-310 bacterium TaxID=2855610 RepID=A0ABV6YRD0_UNCC1